MCNDGENNGSSGNVKKKREVKEKVIERYREGDKKIVGFYDGEGSIEAIVKRVYYYSQNDGGGKEKEENYNNGKLEGKYFEWYKNGQKHYEKNFKNGQLDGKSFEWYENGKKRRKSYFDMDKIIEETCWDNEENEIECEEN